MKNRQWIRLHAGLVIVTAAFLAAPIRAEDATNRYAGAFWAFEDPKSVLAAAAEITTAKYPDCDDATVEQRSVREYHPDGTGECQDETFTKILTEKGKRGNRTVSLSFMLPYSTEEVVKLEVIHPDGGVTPVDIAANSKESIDASQMAENISDPNMRVLQVNIPKVDIGDVVHSVTRQTIERAYIPGEYAEESVFEDSGYIRHLTYEVLAPADHPLKRIALRAEIPGTVHSTVATNTDGLLDYRWEVANVPRMFDEPGMPPDDTVLQRLYISTLPDWQAVSKWYWNLSAPHLAAESPEMKSKVAELTAGAKTDQDKIKAIFYHVSNKIRYMGLTPEKDEPGFEPHDVRLTFEKKYGVCRDKAALLVQMLREAGLNAYPVLISVGDKRDPDVADPYFNHAIVGIETSPSHYELMDPTDENTRELLPLGDRDQSYLICRPEGETLLTSPVDPPENNMMRIKTTGVLNADGSLTAKSQLWFDGVNDDEYRNAFSHMKPDDERRFFERNLKQALPGAKLTSLKLSPTNMLDMSQAVHAEIEFTAEGMTADGNGKSVVVVPWIGKRLGIINFILGGTGLEKRKYPMRTDYTCGLAEDVSLKLGAGFGAPVSLPECAPVDDNCVAYSEHFDRASQTLNCSRELKLKVVEFSPAEYATLKGTLKQLEYDERKTPLMVVLKDTGNPPASADKTPDVPVASDAKILYSHKELEVTDAHTAVYRIKYSKKILTYNGKGREAEIKVDFNPSCQSARLIRGVVISPTGGRQEISSGEINVMDQGWNPSAKRYTGGKTLVANLPGVDIGSTIEVELEITSKGKPFINGFESFQLPDAMDDKTFVLTAPAKLNIQTLVNPASGLVKETDRHKDGQQILRWESSNVKALPAEPQLPPEWIGAASVSYFVGDAPAYYSKVRQTMLDRSSKSVQAAQLARQLAGPAKTRADAVRAIRDYISKNIRLAGPAFYSLPLGELSAADTTLADGYGHMADRAILYYAMLSAAGFKPEFVMASELPPIADITSAAGKFPLPLYFQEPLVRVVVDGAPVYLNDTDQYARLGTTPHDGRLGLALAGQTCEVIQAAKDNRDRTETDYTLSVGNDGRTRIGVVRRYYGSGYGDLNRYFSELPPEERRRYYQELVSGMAQGARPASELLTDFKEYPGVEQYSVDIDNYAVLDGNHLYFDLPFTPGLFSAGAEHRVMPLYVPSRSESVTRTEISLPAAFSRLVIAPRSETFVAPDGAGVVRVTSSHAGGNCVITHQVETDPAIIPPKDYAATLRLEAALERKSSRVFLLEKDSGAAEDTARAEK
jgi:transglutaminase-like putative cysteine protease